jgi:hypothetical protein
MTEEAFGIYNHKALIHQRIHNMKLVADSTAKCLKHRGVGTTLKVGTTVYVMHALKQKHVTPNDPALNEVYKARVLSIDHGFAEVE